MNKKQLSERDICTKFITPALEQSGWDIQTQIREEVSFTDGRIYVRGKLHTRGAQKRADYILYYKPNIPIAVIEAKDNKHSVNAGMQQALGYADTLEIPFVFSSNGDAFLFHDKTVIDGTIETELPLTAFPSPEQLWLKYKAFKGIADEVDPIVAQDYFADGSGRSPRYYQQIAVNRTVETIAKNEGDNRHLLVMATGTGKTYAAFQIIYRLWKSGLKKRILFLADRTALIDQTIRGDFRHFKEAATVIKNKKIDTAYNIYLALYQGLSDNNNNDAYKQFSPDFFDLIIVDECHRGSAREDSKWREILDYFAGATHVGLTATPKETKDVSSSEYFGDPLYTYSLKQGIDDGFLAPYKVIKVTLDVDAEGWRPPKGFKDKDGNPVEDRIYNRSDFDKNIVIDERRKLVADAETEKAVVVQNQTMAKAYSSFVKKLNAYKNGLPAKLVEDLGETVVELYNAFNRNDPEHEKLASISLPLRQNQRLKISYKKDPEKYFDALHILSEGHIRCIGLAILAAKNLKADCPLLIFDDPVNAIDDEHRQAIRETLFVDDYFKEKQFVIAIHGEEFFNQTHQIIGKEAAKNAHSYRFSAKQDQHIRVNSLNRPKNYVLAARELYEGGEYRDSLMNARRALESLTERAWYHYGKHCDKSDKPISVARRAPNQPWDLRYLADNLKSKFNKSKADIPSKDNIVSSLTSARVWSQAATLDIFK